MADLGKSAGDREPILEVRNLVKHFPLTQGILFKKQIGAVKAVDDISFSLYRGETLGIVGESGCGKSTVAKLLMNLETPTSGEIFYKGEDISKLSGRALKAVRRNIQMVFQDPYTSLNPRMTVGDIIGEPFEIHPMWPPRATGAARCRSCWRSWGSTRSTSTGTPTSSPAGSGSGSGSPAVWR